VILAPPIITTMIKKRTYLVLKGFFWRKVTIITEKRTQKKTRELRSKIVAEFEVISDNISLGLYVLIK
jgi:hypothetical protein